MKLALFNFWLNVKCLFRRDRGIFRKQAQNSREVSYCNEYQL